jgi:predicted amidohydrolase YtcJ
MFDDTKLDVPLTMAHLDAVSTRHPIAVNHRGGHTSFYNAKAFELAGVTRETPDPDHGRFFRDANGAHNGRVAELARNVFTRVGTRERFTPEQQRGPRAAGDGAHLQAHDRRRTHHGALGGFQQRLDQGVRGCARRGGRCAIART